MYFIQPTINEDLHRKKLLNFIFLNYSGKSSDIAFQNFKVKIFQISGGISESHKRNYLLQGFFFFK